MKLFSLIVSALSLGSALALPLSGSQPIEERSLVERARSRTGFSPRLAKAPKVGQTGVFTGECLL